MPSIPYTSAPDEDIELSLVNLDDMKLYGYSKTSTTEGKRQREEWLDVEFRRFQ